jgi:hypothetical protein
MGEGEIGVQQRFRESGTGGRCESENKDLGTYTRDTQSCHRGIQNCQFNPLNGLTCELHTTVS